MFNMKYKVGDEVKITDCTGGHEIQLGETRKIARIVNDEFYMTDDDWAIDDDEVELIKPAE